MMFSLSCLSRPAFSEELTQKKRVVRASVFPYDPGAVDTASPKVVPAVKIIHFQMSDPLIFFDSDGKIIPGLAERWERVSPTRFRFFLRKGVEFHNGEKFDGESVKFSLEVVQGPESNGALEMYLGAIKSVWVNPADPYQIEIESKAPYAPFLRTLNSLLMFPKKAIQEQGWAAFHEHPIGTGPFQFSSWEKGKSIHFVKNPKYWQEALPGVDELVFSFSPTEAVFKQLVRGELDLVLKLDGRLTGRVMETGRFKIKKRLCSWQNLILLQNRGPLADRRVRRALNFAIDRDEIIRFAEYGNAIPLRGLAAEGTLGANPQLQPYRLDLQQARNLLRQAGVAGGFRLKALAIADAAVIARILREHLKAIHVELDLTFGTIRDLQQLRRFRAEHAGELADYDLVITNDANNFGDLGYFMRNQFWSKSDWSLLKSSDYDALLEQALGTVDEQEYEKKLKELDAYFYNEALSLFTIQRILTVAARKDLEFEIPLFSSFGNTEFFSKLRVVDR